jgi:hypothetical protein
MEERGSLSSPREHQLNFALQRVQKEKVRERNIGINKPTELTASLRED